jgi:hypothetical protein
MRVLVHVRPNGPYLAVLAAGIVGFGFGVAAILRQGPANAVLGTLVVAGSAAMLILLGIPIVVSTLFRVPALVVDDDGIRLPLMGVRLAWPEVSAVTVLAQLGSGRRPAVLIVPTDSDGVVRQTRPWLRRDARSNLARHGTPLVVPSASLNRSAEDIAAAIRFRGRG